MSAHVGRLVLSVAITVLLGRGLEPAAFGFVALVSSLFAIAMGVLDMGTTAIATREIAARPAVERETLTALLALRRALATVLLVVAIAIAVSDSLVHGKHRVVLIAAAFGLYLLHLHGYQIAYQVRQSYGRAVALGLAGQAVFLAAAVAALALKWAGGAIALLVVAREIFQSMVVRWVGTGMLGYRLSIPWRHRGIWPLLKAGWLIGGAGACYKLATYAGGFFLWELASPEAVASFNAAQRLLVPAGDLAWLFVTPLIASMGAAVAHASGAFRVQFEGYAKFLFAMGALLSVATYFLAPFLLHLLYGDRYAGGPWSSVEVLQWLALAYFFALVIPVLVVAELARGHARPLMLTGLALLAVNIALNGLLVPARGAEGAAMAQCATEAFVFGVLVVRCLARGDARLGPAWAIYLLPAAGLALALYLLADLPAAQFALACAWAPASLVAVLRLPAQRACRASLAAVNQPWDSPPGMHPSAQGASR